MNKAVYFLFTLCIWSITHALQIPSTATVEYNISARSLTTTHDQSKCLLVVTLLGSALTNESRSDHHVKRLEQSVVANVTWCVNNTNGNKYLCPKTPICTSDYNFCPYATSVCNSTAPFKCANGTCVSNPAQQCCPQLNNTSRVWCPHSNTCVNATNSTSSCCSLNSSTPVYCSATKACVAHEFDCCSQNQLVKCGFENKCAPANSSAFCFQPFNRSCSGDFPYQCPNDGTCKKSLSDCSSPRICPPGYTTCPDYSCLPGSNQIASCPQLPTCILKGVVTLARCSDGVTCTENLDKCPTQVTCPIGQVVCPDNTCVDRSSLCVQPPSSATPPKVSTCGLNMVRCADGECAFDCSNRQSRQICTDSGLIQCPRTFKCASNYDNCASNIYCPLASNYTYSSSSVICSEGPNVCTWDASKCRKLSCFNPLFYFNLSNTLTYPWQEFNTQQLMTCPDGRCNPKTTSCMTEVSCSDKFTKGLSVGSYCHNTTTEADEIAQLAFQLNALACPSNMISCLSGHCRLSVYECPQTITCPSASPVQCQDGQCVTSRQSCASIDQLATQSLKQCQDQSMLLCQSDLRTCVTSLELCPTMSTCPMGYSKCSENQCLLDTQCPAQPSICSLSTPFFCRSTGACTQNQTMCLSLTVCPLSKPVKCASDQSCQQQINSCPKVSNQVAVVPTVQSNSPSLITTNHCSSPSLFPCQDGQCRSQCPEWLKCPLITDFQCSDGLCVANATQCSNSSNGCPFYKPLKCNFTAKCVNNISYCANDTTSNLTLANTCAQMFGKTFKGCQLGSCAATNGTCPNITDACKRYLYPNMNYNSSCFVPQCPPTLPFKCDNGLCVEKSKFCPVIPFSASQINKCKSLSSFTQQNTPVPCGDGSCVSRAELCPPLYDCLLNLNLTTMNNANLTVRCNDGTCRSTSMECAALDLSCPYRCQNGMCVASLNECLLANGCSAATPNRCEHNGLCITNSQSCLGTFQLNQALSQNAPKSTSACYTQLKVTCISGDLEYCATNKANCINIDNGCNVFTPVLCGGKCVQSAFKCTIGLVPTLNNRACGQSTPFRCSNTDINSCAALPYSSNTTLYSNVCSAKTQSLLGVYPLNKCTSSLTPISCSDGSCVQNLGDCRTCNFFCTAMMQCTSTSAECQSYSQGKTTSFKNIDQQCPEGVPVRCILDGRCVQSVIECNDKSMSLANTYRSNLIDITCPSDSSLRCVTGKCVNSSVYCQNLTMMNTVQMLKPIMWNATQNLGSSTCQVYCADGSCRDRQQNCPIAQACASPEAPYRCRSGVCSKNQLACAQVYGNSELEPDSSVSAYCYSLFGYNQTQQFFRCEDGTCRPAIFNNNTSAFTSTCLTYLGCPLSAAFQCPTGQCVKTQIECLKFSHSFCNGKYMCKNLMCVTDTSQCSIDQSQISIAPQTIDFNPLLNNNISFIVAENKVAGSINLPSGAITLLQQNFTLTQSVYQKISFQVIPDWRVLNSSVPQNSVNYVKQIFSVTNQTLSLVDSLLFPLFEIRLLDQNQSLLNFNATLSVQLNLPAAFDLASDVCLAMQSQNGSFDCMTRNIQKLESSYSMQIQAFGVYAVIFSPDISLKGQGVNPPSPFPTPNPEQSPDVCNWYCQHKKLVIGLICAAGALLLLIFVIIFICCCIKKKANSNPTIKNNDTKESLITNGKSKNNQKTVKYEKTNPTETQVTEENTGKKMTLNESSSDDNDGRKEKLNEQKMRKQIEKKLKLQVNEELRKERDQFQKSLEVKEQEILNLKSAIKETERRDLSSSPDSRPAYSSVQQKEELKKAEVLMREHFQNEVNRISRELIQQAEEAKNAPPRKFQRSSKTASIKSYSTGSNYGSLPPSTSIPQLDNKNTRSESDLNEQWNVLMDEYPSTKGLKTTQQDDRVIKPRSKRDKAFDSQPNGQQKPSNLTETQTTGYTKRVAGAAKNNDFTSPVRNQR